MMMRRFIAGLLCLALLAVPSSAQLMSTGIGGGGFGAAAGGGSLTYTYAGSSFIAGTPAPPYTFTSLAIGTASADRRVVVSLNIKCAANTASCDPTGVTIGGVSATQAVYRRASSYVASVWYAAVPTGTTANVVISGYANGFVDSFVIHSGSLTGSSGPTVASTITSDPPGYPTGGSQAVTVPAGGVMVLSGVAASNSPPTTSFGWTNATGNYAVDGVNFSLAGSIATATASATITQTVTNSGGADGWSSAQFAP